MHTAHDLTNASRLRRARVGVVGLLVLLGLAGGGVFEGARAQSDPLWEIHKMVDPTTTTTRPGPKPQVAVSTRLATPPGTVATYDRPGGRQIGTFGYWYGYLQSAPILESRNGWLRVRLPERPNGSTAWIRSTHVRITRTPYRIVIRRGQTRLTLYKDGFEQFSAPVGLGNSATPTPLGRFYVGAIEHDASPGYGPFQLGTTGHSEAIQSWKGSGDAVTAIHGPMSKKSSAQIGRTGTYNSNGCVRMHLADLDRLGVVPPGTPVDIVE